MTSRRRPRFLIAYGPTREPLDPVRFISNYSTGTMGRYLVQAAKKRGHAVLEVACPDRAQTAKELEKELTRLLPQADVLVMAAAVCDVRPQTVSRGKIKKKALKTIRFVKNSDILATLSKKKGKGQVFIGFALESEHMRENALAKLKHKKLDLIIAQQVTSITKPFGDVSLKVLALGKDNFRKEFARTGKKELAQFIVDHARRIFETKSL